MKTMYLSQSEWDIGLDSTVFATLEDLQSAQKTALPLCGIEDDFDELWEEGLVGHQDMVIEGGGIRPIDSMACLRTANRERARQWPGNEAIDPLFRAVEFGGESGELLDAVKKLYRARRGIAGNKGKTEEELVQAVREEIGDVLITIDSLADALGIDVGPCVPMKFNMTSQKVGINVYMDSDWEVE